MSINRFVWQLYCASPSGKKALATPFVRFARTGKQPGAQGWRAQTNPKISVHLFTAVDPTLPWESDGTMAVREVLRPWFDGLSGHEAYEQRYRELLDEVGASSEWVEDQHPGKRCCIFFGGDGDEDAHTIAASVGSISTLLHQQAPDDFFPYYFEGQFSLFTKICQSFGIEIPDIPGPRQKKGRALYYLALNNALQEFRQINQLSPKELNALIYDFAPHYLAVDCEHELPAPQRAWFLMAGVGTTADFDLLDNAIDATESNWRGHRDARRGDIAVVWCSSPRAYLHSIWRIIEDGYDDPFSYWYSLVRIGKPIPVNQLKLKDLKTHPVLAESTMVRAHFQGCAGRYFRTVDYVALLEVIELHGTNINALPAIYAPMLPDLPKNEFILDERQVELKLIEPLLLNKLGYYETTHWHRQVRVRMGRGEKVYPDYLIGYRGEKGEERADIVVESKYRIATQRELFEAFLQGRSYALRLQAHWLVLGSLEGVWLLSRIDDFKLEKALHWSWEKLFQADHFSSLERVIGSRAHGRRNS